MSWWQRLRGRASGQAAHTPGEGDEPVDTVTVVTRETGGVPNEDAQNPNSTTGTTPNQEFVGRASGDETGDVGQSGAEARAEWEKNGRPSTGSTS